MSAIKVQNVWKEFDDQIVLENISFEIEPRAFLALSAPPAAARRRFYVCCSARKSRREA